MKNQPPLAGLDPAHLLGQGLAEDTLADEASPPFQPPSLEELAAAFPQFEILEFIGKGGMGAVYKVRQIDLDRIVALKILPPGIGQSPEFSSRFTREARALAKLNHPGIVILREFGQQDGLYFILMEFVDGVNLAQLMKTDRISPRQALAIVPQICDALQYAHDQGIVHRDIKPENILLDRSGRVKVADFGIAKVVASACDPVSSGDTTVPTDATLAGKILGTPQYMAPEQIEHPADVDHRADIYALGVVFYQMLTGEMPDKDLQVPSRKVSIDVRLDEIVLKAMEKNPEQRYQKASVMKTRVEDMGKETTDGISKRPNSKSFPNRKVALVAFCLFVLVAAIAVTGMLVSGWPMPSKSATQPPPKNVSAPAARNTDLRAEEFVALEIAAIQARAAYLENDPIRKQAEEKLANFIETHPDFPNEQSRKVAANRRAELAVNITNLTKKFGPGHTEILQLNRELELLDQVMEIGENQLRIETAAVVMASDLPKENRLQVRSVAQDDPHAEVMENDVGDGQKQELRVSREVIIWDQHIERVSISEGEEHRLDITLNQVGGERLSQATSGEPGRIRLAVMVDGRITSAPVVQNQLGNRFIITGLKSREEALELLRSFPSWDREMQAYDASLWLMLIDEEEFGKSHDSASEFFRNSLTRDQWIAMLAQLRKPLGLGASRRIKQIDDVRSLPGVPDGEYRVIQYETDFPNRRDATETVTLTREKDGVWRASGYFIR